MYHFLKRLGDLLLGALGVLILSPLLLPLLLALRLTAEGEVFYRQRRVGKDKKIFGILKFATMLKDSPNIGTGLITLRDDPRVTPVGKYLRKSKINELPQIFNVLNGEMSWVGPRPLVEKNFLAYDEEVQNIITSVKPGITGIGSIIFRDEEKIISQQTEDPHVFYRSSIAPYKGRLEVWYARNRSLWLDLQLLLLTALVILFPDNSWAYRWFPGLPKRPDILSNKMAG